jgi:hypothetical protein
MGVLICESRGMGCVFSVAASSRKTDFFSGFDSRTGGSLLHDPHWLAGSSV